MPYNTRRKSLSLPALGIQLPQTSRARRESGSTPSAPASDHAADVPPAKRAKHSHGASATSPTAMRPPASAPIVKSVSFADSPHGRHRSGGRPGAHAHTPPPSPPPATASSLSKRVDLDGIRDDIVAGVISQLETTGNRPHLIKELATVLSTTNDAVANSANPAALLSSRLAAYMRRPWTALAPCPVAKELIPVHPRKVFYYLTTTPRQAMPITPPTEPKSGRHGKRIITPSLSNASQDDDDAASTAEDRERAALSPSPEIDLSLDLDDLPAVLPDFPTPGSTLSVSRSTTMEGESEEESTGLNRRAKPAQEGDEREFEATAHYMARRGYETAHRMAMNRAGPEADPRTSAEGADVLPPDAGETDEEGAQKNSEAARKLFGPPRHGHDPDHAAAAPASDRAMLLSSPLMKPTIKAESRDGAVLHGPHGPLGPAAGATGLGAEEAMDLDIGRPENMDLDELDDFFAGF